MRPYVPDQAMKKCVVKLQKRMKNHMGFKDLPPVWFDIDSHFGTQKRYVVCFVRKFNQAMLWWECVHGKLIDPVWRDGSVHVMLHIILPIVCQHIRC